MGKEDFQVELILFVFTLVASISFLSITLLGSRVGWIGYGYSMLYFVFSMVLGVSAWLRTKKDEKG